MQAGKGQSREMLMESEFQIQSPMIFKKKKSIILDMIGSNIVFKLTNHCWGTELLT